MGHSAHVARWLAQLPLDRWSVHLFPTDARPLHAELPAITVHGATRRTDGLAVAGQRGVLWPLPRGARTADRVLERVPWTTRAARLNRTVERLQPDVVHSLEMQHGAYLTLAALERTRSRRPPWIYSCWGSDLFHFGRHPEHVDRVRSILARCDYLTTDCERDLQIASDLGFQGRSMGVFPGPGGYDTDRMQALRQAGPTSARRVIAIKGIEDWAGRALTIVEALRRIAGALSEYEVVAFSALPAVGRALAGAALATGLRYRILPPSSPEEIYRLLGSARVAVGHAISDGSPNSMLEAMVMGALPVQSDTVAPREWITDGDNGLLVPPEDSEALAASILRAVEDDELVDRAAVRNACLTRARIDRSVILPRVLALYEQAALAATKVERTLA